MQETVDDLLDPIAQRWSFLVLFTKRTFGTHNRQRGRRCPHGQRVVYQVVYRKVCRQCNRVLQQYENVISKN